MNAETGMFEDVREAPVWATTIEVGEIVKIKGEECEVTRITRGELTLKLLSKKERFERYIGDPRNRHERRAEAAGSKHRN